MKRLIVILVVCSSFVGRLTCSKPFTLKRLVLPDMPTSLNVPVKSFRHLGLTVASDRNGCKKAYKTKSLKAHPDKPGGSNEAFQELKNNYDILNNYFDLIDYGDVLNCHHDGLSDYKKQLDEWWDTSDQAYRDKQGYARYLKEYAQDVKTFNTRQKDFKKLVSSYVIKLIPAPDLTPLEPTWNTGNQKKPGVAQDTETKSSISNKALVGLTCGMCVGIGVIYYYKYTKTRKSSAAAVA